MKTPDFWYKPEGFLSALLSPLGSLYSVIAKRRLNTPPVLFTSPVICVGNIVAGGAGKTPAVLALCEILKKRGAFPIVSSRGYGSRIKVPTLVDPQTHLAEDVGDEPLLISYKFPCIIGHDRVKATAMAAQQATHVILDDGFQNARIGKNISLIVIDGPSGIGNGHIIPSGPLRERLEDAMQRATAIILVGEDKHNLLPRINIPVLRAFVQPCLPEGLSKGDAVFAFSGIARPAKFYSTCAELGLTVVGTQDFPDHHFFTVEEIIALREKAASLSAKIVTTEKDLVRFYPEDTDNMFAVPVKLAFDQESQKKLEELLPSC